MITITAGRPIKASSARIGATACVAFEVDSDSKVEGASLPTTEASAPALVRRCTVTRRLAEASIQPFG